MEKKGIFNFTVILSVILFTVSSCSPNSPVTILPTITKIAPTLTQSLETPTKSIQQKIEIPDIEKFSEIITIKFWHPWSGDASRAIELLIKEFNSTNTWGIQVNEFSYGNEDYLISKAQNAMQNQEKPEVIAAPISFLRNLFSNGNGLINLLDYANHAKFGLTDEEKISYPLTFWQQDTIDGSRFGMPAQRDAHVLFYNQSWARELGFETPPSTPDEFLNQSCAAARANSFDGNPDNNGTGGWIYNSDPETVLSWMKAFNGGEMPANEGDQYIFGNQPNIAAFSFLQQIIKLGCAWVGKEPDPYRYFASRNALFYSGDLQDILIQEKNANKKDQWTIISYPSLKGNDVVLTDGLSYGIFKSTSEKDLAAWLFIRWMQKPANQAKLIYATSTYYLTSATLDELNNYRQKHPAWDAALQYLPLSKSAPILSTWNIVGKVLQDASWQLAQSNIKTGDVPDILGQVDKLIKEIVQK
jgi:multiple sugar transport system substrate-binding protein